LKHRVVNAVVQPAYQAQSGPVEWVWDWLLVPLAQALQLVLLGAELVVP
jgi:hypothetical protein